MEEEKAKRVVEERKITPCQALFASFLAALSEAGVLNQATVNFMARRAAPRLRAYLKVMGLLDSSGGSPRERFKRLVKSLDEALGIGYRLEFREDGDYVYVGLGGSMCRYCPKGIGGAAIPGTACPFPRLIEQLARLEGIHAEYTTVQHNGRPAALERSEGLCWIRYRVPG